MSAIINTRDLILQAYSPRVTTSPSAPRIVILTADATVFHTASSGATSPSAITFTAALVGLSGLPTFTTNPSTPLSGAGLVRSLAYTDMTTDTVTVTAAIVDNGVTYASRQVITKISDGIAGLTGNAYAVAYLYQFSSVPPAAPSGTSTFNWNNGTNGAYTGNDGWAAAVPTNPGGPSVRLWVASKGITVAAGTATSTVTYSGADVSAYSANGAAGVKSANARAYQWGLSAPTTTGTAVYTWGTASYDAPPQTGWLASKPASPGQGFTLYEATVPLVDSTGAATTNVDWTLASIVGIGYYGNNGSSTNGTQGNSAVRCYTLIDGNSLAVNPLYVTIPGTGYPTTGTWGETRAWTAQPGAAGASQAVFQSDGIYYPGANHTIWNVPYLSNLKVGNLSAISANTGNLTVTGNIDAGSGNFTVDASGNVNAKAITIRDGNGLVILASGVALEASYAPAGTRNSALSIGSNGILYGGGGGQVTIPGMDNSVIRAGYPITPGNVATYIASASIGGVLLADNTIYAEKIISASATELAYTRQLLASAGDTNFTFYMSHQGNVTIQVLASLNINATAGASAVNESLIMSIDGVHSYSISTTGVIVPQLHGVVSGTNLPAGQYNLRVSCTSNYSASQASADIIFLRSYR